MQKTADAMRMSDWSSGVCSSDLDLLDPALLAERAVAVGDDLRAQVHHDVDRGGELANGQLAGDLRALLHGARDELLNGVLGAAGGGGADRARAGLHGLEHGPDLRAADLPARKRVGSGKRGR